MPRILYTKGFKYQLAEMYKVQTPITGYRIITDYCTLQPDGMLTIFKDFAWDGPSGPTIDTKTFMRGSLVHDVLYKLLREERLPQSERFIADKLLQYICIEDGMWKLRAWIVFQAVHYFAKSAASPTNRKRIISAPK